MAAPIASYVQLPDDSGNTGKKPRTQTRVVGANTVHEHFFVPTSQRAKLGVFHYSTTLQSVKDNASAQDGTTTGFFWLANPVGSTIELIVREIALQFSAITGTAMVTVPHILAQRFTLTGTASGGTVTPAKRRSSEAANVGSLRTAVTGMTPSLGATVKTFLTPIIISAASPFAPPPQVWPTSKDPLEDGGLVLAAGEGLVLYQPDAGTASEVRRFTVDATTEEADVS